MLVIQVQSISSVILSAAEHWLEGRYSETNIQAASSRHCNVVRCFRGRGSNSNSRSFVWLSHNVWIVKFQAPKRRAMLFGLNASASRLGSGFVSHASFSASSTFHIGSVFVYPLVWLGVRKIRPENRNAIGYPDRAAYYHRISYVFYKRYRHCSWPEPVQHDAYNHPTARPDFRSWLLFAFSPLHFLKALRLEP